MRILIFTEVVSPYECGISSYVEVLKKGLEKLSHKVIVVTSSLETEKACYMNGVIRCPAKPANNKYGYECKNPSDMKVIDFICSFKPDVVHIHTDTKIGYMGLEVADIAKVPVVFTIHDYFMDRFAHENHLVWKFKTYFEKRHFVDMLDNADVVTSSCARADMFVRRAKKKTPVRLVPSAADTDVFDYKRYPKSVTDKVREKIGLSKTATTAVFAGSLSVEKNLEFALTAFARYIKKSDNIQFLIVGDGTETEYLKNLCKKLKIDDMVYFAGTVSHKRMPEIYAASDMYVCSYDDGLISMSFGEAMASGLPVLIKEDRENLAYSIIQDGVNGFVCRNEEEFANYLKMHASLADTKKRRIKGIVRKTVLKKPYTSMAETYLSIYKSIPKKKK